MKNKINNILQRITKENTGGYFYKNNCRINYSPDGFYCKDFILGYGIKTYKITKKEAIKKVKDSLK